VILKKVNYIWLIFPISIFVAAFLVLTVNLFPDYVGRSVPQSQEEKKRSPTKTDATQSPEKALPYFILAAVFMVLILVLPRLQELSISEKSLVLKLISEVKEEARQLETELPLPQQEVLKTERTNDKVLRIQEKIALLEQLLKNNK
jgi:hypothetical protein